MLSKDTKLKIKAMDEDQSVGQEIINRMSLLQERPEFAYQIKDILKNLDTSEHMSSKIEKTFRSKMSNYDHGSCGDDIALTIREVPALLLNALYDRPGKKTRDTINKIEFEALALALSGIGAAKDFEVAYDNMLSSLTNLKVTQGELPEVMQTIERSLVNQREIVSPDPIHEDRVVLKRIRLRKK